MGEETETGEEKGMGEETRTESERKKNKVLLMNVISNHFNFFVV